MPDKYQIVLGIENSQADAAARASLKLMQQYERQCLAAARAAQAAFQTGGTGSDGQAAARAKTEADAVINSSRRVASETSRIQSQALGPHGRLAQQQRIALNERTLNEAAFNRAQDAHHNKLINQISKERYGYQTSFREAVKGAIGFDDAIIKLGSTMLGLSAGRALVNSVASAMRAAEEAGTRMAKKVIDTATALKEIALIRGKFAPDDTELQRHINMRVQSGLSQTEAVVFESELLNQLGTVSEQRFPQAERTKLSILGAKQAARGGGGETGVQTRARMLGLLPSFVPPDQTGVVTAEVVNAMGDEIDRIAQMGAASPAMSTSQAAELITKLTTEKLAGTFHDPRKAVALSTIASQFQPESSAEAALQAIRQGRDFLKFKKMKGAEAAKGETLRLAGVKETMDPAQTLVKLFEFAKANMKEDEAFDTFLLRRGFTEKRGNEKLMEFYNTYLKGEFTRIMDEADKPIDQTLPGKKFKAFAAGDVGRTQLQQAKQDEAELERGKRKREQEHARAEAQTAYTAKGLEESPLMQWGRTLMGVPGYFVGKTGKEVELDIIALAKARREAGQPELSGPALFREAIRGDVPAEINRLRFQAEQKQRQRQMGKPILGPGTKALPGLPGAEGPQAMNGGIPGMGLHTLLAMSAVGAIGGPERATATVPNMKIGRFGEYAPYTVPNMKIGKFGEYAPHTEPIMTIGTPGQYAPKAERRFSPETEKYVTGNIHLPTDPEELARIKGLGVRQPVSDAERDRISHLGAHKPQSAADQAIVQHLKDLIEINRKTAETNAAMLKQEMARKATQAPPTQPVTGPAQLAGR